jgi:hypothetical protein
MSDFSHDVSRELEMPSPLHYKTYQRLIYSNVLKYWKWTYLLFRNETVTTDCYMTPQTRTYTINRLVQLHHHHMSVMELGHLLTRSGLTYLEVSSMVCHDSFCQLGNSVSLSWVICYKAFCLHVTFSSYRTVNTVSMTTMNMISVNGA